MKFASSLLAFLSIAAAAAAASAFSAAGFQNPYGVAVDPQSGSIYISNVNGAPDARDDNGFISRLKADGSLDALKLIDGASPDIALHAPKGMAVMGGNLYVADLDKLHVFGLAGGPNYDINFGDLPVAHFYDISTGPDEALYLADGGAGIIYRIDVPRMHEVTAFASGGDLHQPRGICWYPTRQIFMVADAGIGEVIAYDRSGRRQAIPEIFLKSPEGIRGDDAGNLILTSPALSSAFRIAPSYALSSYLQRLDSPAGLAYHSATKEVIISSSGSGVVQSFPLTPAQ